MLRFVVFILHDNVLYLFGVPRPFVLELVRLLLQYAHEFFIDAFDALLPLLYFFHFFL